MSMTIPTPNETIQFGFDFSAHLSPKEDGEVQSSPGAVEVLPTSRRVASSRLRSEGSEPTPVVFDRAHALKRLGGLDHLLNEVLELVQSEAPKVLDRMAVSLRNRESDELGRAAHTLKGTAGIIGAGNLVERLAKIEKRAATGDFDAVTSELPEIERQLVALQAVIARELS